MLLQPADPGVQAEADGQGQETAGGEPGAAGDAPVLEIVVRLDRVAAGRDLRYGLSDKIFP